MTGAWKNPKPQNVAPANWVWSDADILAVLWRCDGLGQTAAQIALIFGTTPSAIKGVIHRARAKCGVRIVRLMARHEARMIRKGFDE